MGRVIVEYGAMYKTDAGKVGHLSLGTHRGYAEQELRALAEAGESNEYQLVTRRITYSGWRKDIEK